MVIYQQTAKEEHEGKIYETIEEWDDLTVDPENPIRNFIRIISKTEIGTTTELESKSLLTKIKDLEARLVIQESK